MKNVSSASACLSAASNLPCRDSSGSVAWILYLDTGPRRMLELESGLGSTQAGAAAAGAPGWASWDLEIHQIPL